MRLLFVLCMLIIVGVEYAHPQMTSRLPELLLCVDPGHGPAFDGSLLHKGAYGYSETEKALSIALHVRAILERAGVDSVILTRLSNSTNPTITQRAAIANNADVDWVISIHSGSTSNINTNHVSTMFDGSAEGGSASILNASPQMRIEPRRVEVEMFARLIADKVARSLRIPSNHLQRTWNNASRKDHSGTTELFRYATMPVIILEAGYHSNAVQNLREMNDEYRRVIALMIANALLEHYSVPRMPVRKLLGIVSDKTTNAPLGDVNVETHGQIYRTQSWHDSYKRTNLGDSTASNGFYYLENLPNHVANLRFQKNGYRDTSVSVAVSDTFFTFQDVAMTKMYIAGASEEPSLPFKFSLDQNYPNPFNPSTVIRYSIPTQGNVRLDILNLLGEPIATLINEEQTPGEHLISWNAQHRNGSTVPSGVYFYKLHYGSKTLTRKMIFVR